MRDAPYRFCLLAIWVTSALACPSPSSSRPEEPSPDSAISGTNPGPRRSPERGPVRYRRVETPDPSSVTREELIQALNAERVRAGVAPLRTHPVLTQVAQGRADEISQNGALPNGAESTRMLGVVQRRLVQGGYTAHGWVESVVSSDGDAAEVIAYWRSDPSFSDLLRADYSDLGLGESRLGNVPLYLLLVAKPEAEVYAVEVHDLTDLGATRAAMIAGVNRLRADAGLKPLKEDSRLDAAAQEHAEDMLARNYYEHESPEGKDVGDRLTAEGYSWRLAAENLAAGQLSVDSVLEGWMKSSGHRANLLRPNVTDFGFGLAVGAFDSRYRVLWVQTFGAPVSGSAR